MSEGEVDGSVATTRSSPFLRIDSTCRYERARTHLLALRVDDRVAAERTLVERGVRVLRSDALLTVVDPADTGGVQIALADQLLPGDPRR